MTPLDKIEGALRSIRPIAVSEIDVNLILCVDEALAEIQKLRQAVDVEEFREAMKVSIVDPQVFPDDLKAAYVRTKANLALLEFIGEGNECDHGA